MPRLTAHGKIFRDWEALLGACEKNANLLTGMEPLRTELETFLTQVRDLKLQQESLTGNKKAATQSLGELLEQGVEVSRRLRAFVVSRIGTKTELGTMFGLVPTGRKGRKKSKTPVAKPPAAPPATAAAGPEEPPSPVQTKGEEG